MVKVFVMCGDGINCEKETALPFKYFGADVQMMSISSWVADKIQLTNFDIFVLPGGFSFGDELGSGQVLALKLKTLVADQIFKFYQQGGLILGICNGFQVLTKMGLLPVADGTSRVALDQNRDGQFIDRWETLVINSDSPCVWTKGLAQQTLELPVRHGEGRLQVSSGYDLPQHLQVFHYQNDINGSYQKIAGLTDERGQILGLMPHPEGYFFSGFHPRAQQFNQSFELGQSAQIFKNAIEYSQTRRR